MITRADKKEAFFTALKFHLLLYIMAFVFLFGFGGVGGGLLYFVKDLDIGLMIFSAIFLFVGIGVFLLLCYLNVSSMRYHYENALMKKYGHYTKAAMIEVAFKSDAADGVIRCFITVRYANKEYSDLFELPSQKEQLLPILKTLQYVPVRVVDDLPKIFRIAPKKLLQALEEAALKESI